MKKKESHFKLKNLVLLLGLTSLTQGYSITTYTLTSAGTITESPSYGNIPSVVLLGNTPAYATCGGEPSAFNLQSNVYFLNGNTPQTESYFFANGGCLIGGTTPLDIVDIGILSTYGLNNLYYINADGPGMQPKPSEQDNFAYYQYNFKDPSYDQPISLTIGTQSSNNLVSQPSIKSIQEVEPADSNDNDMPIYHIVVNSGYGMQDSTANSTVASAYYFNAYDSSPFDSSSVGDSVVEPLSVIADPNDSTDYGLSQADFYYHGDLKNIGIYQNINYFPQQDNYSSSMYSGSDTENLSKATPPTPPSGASEPTYNEASTFTISLQPVDNATSNMADPIYANGMNQAPFTVTIYTNDGTKKLSPTDSTYGWLYGLIYFKDLDTGSIISNLQNNFGSEAITMNPGPYTKSNASLNASPLSDSSAASNTFYYSSAQAGNHDIEVVLEIPTSDGAPVLISSSPLPPLNPKPLVFQVANNLKLSATNASFPSSNSTSSGSMSFSNSIQSASSDSPATYLNLDNPAHPIYVGFVRYPTLSAYNFYSYKNGSYYYTSPVNLSGPDMKISGSRLNFSYSYNNPSSDPINSYPNEIGIDVVDEYGNFYQTAGYGD